MMEDRYFRLARHWALFCPTLEACPYTFTDILEMFGTLIEGVVQHLFIIILGSILKLRGQEEGMGSQVLRSEKFCWVLGKLSGNLSEWDCSYNRRPLLGEMVEKFLSREVLKGPVVLALKVVITGNTGLKSFKNNVLQTPGTLVSAPYRCLWVCCFSNQSQRKKKSQLFNVFHLISDHCHASFSSCVSCSPDRPGCQCMCLTCGVGTVLHVLGLLSPVFRCCGICDVPLL